jgi:hypothetical protein
VLATFHQTVRRTEEVMLGIEKLVNWGKAGILLANADFK